MILQTIVECRCLSPEAAQVYSQVQMSLSMSYSNTVSLGAWVITPIARGGFLLNSDLHDGLDSQFYVNYSCMYASSVVLAIACSPCHKMFWQADFELNCTSALRF